ncbi:hypothetical protein C8Q76DRAFT_687899 [Earliella scabrosa]|nr:hypothetical protein C8Q76DRAFT_687899 [Earliella scabrosa]
MSVRTTINPVVRMLVLIEEYRMVWKRKLSLPTALFLINRYVLLFIAVMYPLSTLLWWRDDFSCVVISNARISLSVALLAVNVGLVSVVLNIIVFASATTGTNAPNARGCYGTLGVVGHSRSEWVRESLVIRGCTIVQDVLVLGITWYRTSGIVAGLSIASTPVASVLLRNGLLRSNILLVRLSLSNSMAMLTAACHCAESCYASILRRLPQWSGSVHDASRRHLHSDDIIWWSDSDRG